MQATMSAIDFDYLGYAAKRLEAFRDTRTTSWNVEYKSLAS